MWILREFAQNAQMYRNLQFLATLFYILSHKMRTNHDGDQRKPILERGMIAGLDGTKSYTAVNGTFGSKIVFFSKFSYFWQIFDIFWNF